MIRAPGAAFPTAPEPGPCSERTRGIKFVAPLHKRIYILSPREERGVGDRGFTKGKRYNSAERGLGGGYSVSELAKRGWVVNPPTPPKKTETRVCLSSRRGRTPRI